MKEIKNLGIVRVNKNFHLSFLFVLPLLVFLPVSSSFATSGIAGQVAAFCGTAPIMPDVTSCSACHSSANPGLNDLTPEGVWAQNGQFINFCPTATTTPPPTPTPTPAPGPTPGTGTGMGSPGTGTGMGMGSGGSLDDDDDEEGDDDDDGVVSSAIRAFSSAFRSRD